MSGTGVNSLEDVFKKWEKKGEERRKDPSRISQATGCQSNGDLYGGGVVQPGRSSSAWTQRFDNSAVPKRRTSKRRNQDFNVSHSSNLLSSAPVERKFHLLPPFVENLHRTSRPFLSTGCSRCSQKSKATFITEKVTNSPLRNLLDLSVFCRKSLFRRAFSDVLYVAALPSMTIQKKPDLKNVLFNSSKVSLTIEKLTSVDNSNIPDGSSISVTSKELHSEADKVITGMHSCIKGYLIRLSTWLLLKFFGKILSSIQVHQGQITMLHEASKKNISIVYLPCHKSHMDYVLISFVLSCYGLKVPYIAAGDNLKDIPLFSWLLRNMGGFFIKRSLGEISPQNELYKEILNENIVQILESGSSLEVFIEGTRSRTGKNYPPKIGVLSSVVSAVKEGRVSDVLIVPVNISYEKILEENYCDELLGVSKKPESFLQAVKGIWRIVHGYYGQIRVDFGLPSSLMENIHALETSEACQTFMKTLEAKSTSLEHSSIKKNMSEISLHGLNCADVAMTKCIAHHVIHDSVQCSTIMATNMVAFLLLTSFRKGAKMKDLVSSFELLKKDILIRNRDFGFSGSNETVISHSLRILGKELVSCDETSRIIRPNIALPVILKLSYYANQVVSVYALESVVACSVCALLNDKDISLVELTYQDATISRKELVDAALDLCDLLHQEFVFSPPCVSLESRIIEAIESFIAADILNVCEDQSAKSRERQWANRLAVSTGWFDDNDEEEEIQDQEYKVNSSEGPLQKLHLFHSILSPIIESYWLVACGLLWLQHGDFSEKDFVKALNDNAIERVKIGTAFYNESCSITHTTNAVKVFKDYNILCINHADKISNTSRIHLCDDFQSEHAILHLIGQIRRYKT